MKWTILNSIFVFQLTLIYIQQIFSHLLRLGVDLGQIDQLLHVYPLLNREYLNAGDGRLTLSKNWSRIALAVAPKTTIRDLVVFAKDMENFKQVEDVFTQGSTVFLLNKSYYGCEATISESKFYNGRIKCKCFIHRYYLFAFNYSNEILMNFVHSISHSSPGTRFQQSKTVAL